MRPTFAKSFLSTSVLAAVTLAMPLTAAAQTQETVPDQTILQLWKDPNVIPDLQTVAFDFDNYESVSQPAILEADAQWLKDHADVHFTLAAYADPRGDIVYNLALSQRRAETVKQELVRMGIAEDRIAFAIGWGKLYPNCLEPSEECWQQNRRVEFVYAVEGDRSRSR